MVDAYPVCGGRSDDWGSVFILLRRKAYAIDESAQTRGKSVRLCQLAEPRSCTRSGLRASSTVGNKIALLILKLSRTLVLVVGRIAWMTISLYFMELHSSTGRGSEED
jgi:hypothetical protein